MYQVLLHCPRLLREESKFTCYCACAFTRACAIVHLQFCASCVQMASGSKLSGSLPPTSDGIIRHVRKIRLHQRAHYAFTKWYILDSCLQGQRAQNMFGSSKAVRCNLCIVQLCTNGNPAPKYQRPHPQAIASRHIWAHCEYSPHTLCVSKGGSDSLSHLLWSPDVRDLEYGFVPPRPACRIWGSVMHRYQQWQYDTIETMIWFLSTQPCEQHSEHSIRCGRVQRHFHLQTKALWGWRLFPNIVFCLPQSQDTKTLPVSLCKYKLSEDALYYDRVWSDAMLMPCR